MTNLVVVKVAMNDPHRFSQLNEHLLENVPNIYVAKEQSWLFWFPDIPYKHQRANAKECLKKLKEAGYKAKIEAREQHLYDMLIVERVVGVKREEHLFPMVELNKGADMWRAAGPGGGANFVPMAGVTRIQIKCNFWAAPKI